MSDLFAHGRVRISPDMTGFRQQFEAQLAASVAGVKIPSIAAPAAVAAVPAALSATTAQGEATKALAGNVGAATIRLESLAAVQKQVAIESASAAGAIATQNVTLAANAAATAEAAAAAHVLEGRLAGARAGVLTTTLSMLGLRQSAIATQGPFLAAAAAVVILVKSLGSFIEFNKTLSVLRVTAKATSDEMQQVGKAARDLGTDVSLPGTSAKDAADAMLELSKAGLSIQQSIAGARGVLQLATAAELSVGDAAQLAANELNAFGLSGDQATHVADVLANASIAAQGSIEDFGLAFRQSAAVAHQVGLSLEDTSAILTVMAKAGLQGSDAGTSLRTALIRLIAPGKQANQILEALHINIRDASGAVRPEVFEEFATAVAKLPPNLRDAATAIVFGTDAIRGVAIAGEAGAAGLKQAQNEVAASGTAADLANAQMVGLGGSIEQLRNNASELGLELGALASGPAKEFTDGLVVITGDLITVGHEVEHLTGLIPHLGDAFSVVGKGIGVVLSGALLPGVSQFLAIRKVVGVVQDAVTTSQDEIAQSLQKGALQRTFFNPSSLDKIGTGVTSQLSGLTDAFTASGKKLGQATVKGMVEGLSEHQQAVNAAKTALADAQQAAQESITQSVISAKANLESIGGEISGEIAQAFSPDLDPQIKKLQAQLDKMRDTVSRAGLTQSVRDAQRDLQKAQEGISVSFFGSGPSGRALQEVNDVLDPLRTKVKGAKADLKEFSLNDLIDGLTKARKAQADATTRTLNDVISLYQHGAISIGQLNSRLTALFNSPTVKNAVATAGKTLGGSFGQEFQDSVQAFFTQAALNAPFQDRPGTGPVASRVQSPAAQVAKSNEAVARAQTALKNAINGKGNATVTGKLDEVIAAINKANKPPGHTTSSTTGQAKGPRTPRPVSTGTKTGGAVGGGIRTDVGGGLGTGS